MKPSLIALLMLVTVLTVCFAEPTHAERWMSLEFEYKGALIVGFMLGMDSSLRFIDELPGDAAEKNKPKGSREKNINTAISDIFSKGIDYWVKEMDAFYSRQSKSGVNYGKAFWTVIIAGYLPKN